MDVLGKMLCGLIFVWAAAMVVGVLIALMPVILFVLGFVLMLGLLTLIGRLVGSWID